MFYVFNHIFGFCPTQEVKWMVLPTVVGQNLPHLLSSLPFTITTNTPNTPTTNNTNTVTKNNNITQPPSRPPSQSPQPTTSKKHVVEIVSPAITTRTKPSSPAHLQQEHHLKHIHPVA